MPVKRDWFIISAGGGAMTSFIDVRELSTSMSGLEEMVSNTIDGDRGVNYGER